MKLFVWEGDKVLTDYSDGMIVVLAETLEEAHKVFLDKCSYAKNAYPEQPTSIIDLTQPIKPQAWYVWGGG